MDQPTLKRALDRLTKGEALTNDGGVFRSAEDHHLTFYLGQPGQAMVLKEIVSVEIDEGFLVLTRSSDDSTLMVQCDAVHAVASVAPRSETGRRAGFA